MISGSWSFNSKNSCFNNLLLFGLEWLNKSVIKKSKNSVSNAFIISIATSKDVDVLLRYTGTSGGITEPWVVIVDSYSTKGKDHSEAINRMMALLKSDLEKKIKSTEDQAHLYKKTLSDLYLD